MGRTGLAACGAVLLTASYAHASDTRQVVVLGAGADGEAVAAGVASRLSPPYSSVDSAAFRRALGAAIRLVPLAIRRHDRDAEFVARARAAARSAHADEAIVVYAERSRRVLHVWAIEAQAATASLDQEVRLGAGASAGDAADAAWSAVAPAFPAKEPEPPAPVASEAPSAPPATTTPPEREAPAATGVAAPSAPASSVPPPDPTRGTSFAILELAMEGGTRHFSYVDRLTPTLRPYDLFVAPLLAIHGEAYPFKNVAVPVISGLGATGSYARAFALSSQDAAGNRVGTTWQAFDLGVRERLRLGDSFILGVDLGYGGNDFTFDVPVTAAAQLPSIQYKMLRAGLDGRVGRGALSAHAAASYLDVLSTGDFGALFPRTTVGGVEAALGISESFASSFEVSLDASYTRFFYSLLPQPGDPYVAGGALDQMATVSLSLAHLF
jgi:hypothetical protein